MLNVKATRVAYRIFFSGGGGGGGGRGDLTDDLCMYIRRCHTYNIILVNKSHNNAVISFCLCIIYAVYITCILL